MLKLMWYRTCPSGFLPPEGPVEEDLPQQHRDGVPGPQVLAEDLPQLYCGKGAGQLAAEEWHCLDQVATHLTTDLLCDVYAKCLWK